MKKLLLIGALMALAPAARAIDMAYTESYGQRGVVTQSTVTFSSSTVLSITPTSDYYEITFSSATALWYYRIDDTTSSVTTVGFPVAAGTEKTIKVFKGKTVAVQLTSGASSQEIRTVRFSAK